MARTIGIVGGAGAGDVALIAAVTPHKYLGAAQQSSPIPLFDIVEATARDVKAAGYGAVGLLGTRPTLTEPFFKGKLERSGVRVTVPGEDGIADRRRRGHGRRGSARPSLRRAGSMKSIALETDIQLGFELARRLAGAVASAYLGESTCLSWYDRASEQESPAHASDCHGSCEVPGYLEYAMHRGAELRVVVQSGAFVFCFMSLGEFADAAG